MKNNTLKMLALLAGIILSIGSAHAANMSYTLYADLTVNLPTASSPSNQNGRVWLGNFGNGTSLLSLADVQSGNNSLLNSFRPLTSFEITGGSLRGDTGNGLRGSGGTALNVGNSSITAGNFAGQDAYLLALSSTSSVWSEALSAWQADASYKAILILSGDSFSLNTSDPTADFALERENGQLIFGTQTANSITSAAVPEPSVTTLLVFGVLGLGALRLRRQTA
jgi:hypothetical protein